MKIEAIEATRSRQGRLRLRFSDGRTMMVLPALIADQGLYAGMELPETAYDALLELAGAASAKERAVRIISAAPVTKKELESRLIRKGETVGNASDAVRWLEDLQLLDDGAVAEQIVRSGAAKGYGAARIRQMLYEKQVPKEYWDEALARLPASDGAIDAFLHKRFHGKRPDEKELRRATDALLRRGHRWEEIRRAIGRYTENNFFEE